MAQETTRAFGERFTQAVAQHPLTSPTPHGRQRWVLDKLEKETGLRVSANTMSKWFHGQAMPRSDNLRKIARILGVDEVWLALGQKPVVRAKEVQQNASMARGATLVIAGMIEMQGGQATFSGNANSPVDLTVNVDGRQAGLAVVTPQKTVDQWTFAVPEPIGDARILSVETPVADPSGTCVRILDLTDCPRQMLGGYSILVVQPRKDGRVKVQGQRALLAPVATLLDVIPPRESHGP